MRKSKKPKAIWTQAFPEQRNQRNGTGRHTADEIRCYRAAARMFVNVRVEFGDTCHVVDAIPELRNGFRYGHRISNRLTEVHHTRGRAGALLLDKRFWIAVSRIGHRWIHSNPAEARRRGWLCAVGEWNKPTKH